MFQEVEGEHSLVFCQYHLNQDAAIQLCEQCMNWEL